MKNQIVQIVPKAGRERWSGQPCHVRLKAVQQMYVEHAAVKNLLAHIKRQLLLAQSRGMSCGTLVIAPSGAGKSSFIKHLHHLYPDVTTEELTERPVVHFKVPSSPTPKQLGAAFLRALGDPLYKKGTAEDKLERIAVLLSTCKTVIIAIDDFQDVPARRGAAGVKQVGDWVRDICEMKFPGILLAFGTEDAAVVRDSNDQLQRRMMARVELPMFTLGQSKSATSFGTLLRNIDEMLPLAQSSGLDQPQMAARIFLATAGNFDYLSKLLNHSLVRALERGSERIEREDLEAGFDDQHQVAAHQGNPFSETYDGMPLDRPGQIFYKSPEATEIRDDVEAVKKNKKSRKA